MLDWHASDCLLCDIIQNEQTTPFHTVVNSSPTSSEKLLETASFVVIADIGPIVEGYCLIVSRSCVPAIAHLPREELAELAILVDCLQEAMQEVFGESILFEHGAATFTRNAGACIEHAHLHVVPTSIDLAPQLTDMRFEQQDNSLWIDQLEANAGYLYYENQRAEKYLALVDRCAQQYFRRKLSQAVEPATPWNWHDFIRYPEVLGTKDLVQGCIDKLSKPLARIWACKSALHQ